MRYYSTFEKQVIQKILQLDSGNYLNCATNIFFDIEGIYGLSPGFSVVLTAVDWAEFSIDSERFNTQARLRDFHMSMIRDLYEFILLMDHLVEDQYIALSATQFEKQTIPIGQMLFEIHDDNLHKKTGKYFSSMYVPTSKLKLLKRLKFRDLSTYNTDRQFRITTVVAGIAAFAAIASVVLSVFSLLGVQEVRINNDPISIAVASKPVERPISIEFIQEIWNILRAIFS